MSEPVERTPGVAPLAVVERSGVDESYHAGAVAVVDADGTVVDAIGDPNLSIYARSANKPLQIDAMIATGLVLGDEELALGCASHDGTPRHIGVVRRILASAELDEADLRNTPALPMNQDASQQVVAQQGGPRPILMGCSGKHAAMLATCRHHGWPLEDYLDVQHPLQISITEHLSRLVQPPAHIGVDGCGAPAHVFTLSGLAAGFVRLAQQRTAVWRAMTRFPELVGGERRIVTQVMRALPGTLAKDGAEGVFALAHPDGWGVAIKIADGQERPIPVVLADVLDKIGVSFDASMCSPPVLGHGRPVGHLRSVIR